MKTNHTPGALSFDRRRRIKRQYKIRTARVSDQLAPTPLDRHIALASLQRMCIRAGKDKHFIYEHIYAGILSRNNDLQAFDVFRRIGACYVKFLPQRAAIAKATGEA